MKTLIAGLGNPGKKYEKTRHNVGFRVIDGLESLDSSSTLLGINARDKNIIFLKPDNFMNDSGRAVKEYLDYEKIPVSNLIVIHDDIDLLFGDVRVSKDSSSAGHKGVQSIINELGTQNFTRIRIGIQPELKVQSQKLKVNTTDFVLKNFSKTEEEKLPEIIKKAVGMISIPLS
ncbi:MAG: aminoacyl-tRNA hydrolase [Patescibacteria group bacterium]